MIALDGQSALSPFRLERLNARLDALHRGARVQACWFVYFIDADTIDVRGRRNLPVRPSCYRPGQTNGPAAAAFASDKLYSRE